VFRAANHGLLWLIALALFGSLISLYYYLVVLRAVLSDNVAAAAARDDSLGRDRLQEATVAVLALAVLLLGILPQALVARIVAAMM
ncbi:MAG TPA: hypothetical protein VGC85_06260, partial [Chthoniobacterales bacterium]